MKTKFYNGLHRECDINGYSVENWDSSREFAENEYAKVYFRIDCPTFDIMRGMFCDASDRDPFYAEARAVLQSFGIAEGTGYIMRGEAYTMEHLHIHPQDISGVVAKSKIVSIVNAINGCKLFSCRSVDVYEDIYAMTNEQFKEALQAKRYDIEKDILSAFTTKRKNLYYGEYSADGLLCRISDKYAIRRRQCESGTDYTAKAFCAAVLSDLVASGKIITAKVKDGIGYRTAKRGESLTINAE